MVKPVIIAFGGVSSEHEVSVITGLQVLENIDTGLYEPYVIYLAKKGEILYLPQLKNRSGFFRSSRKPVVFGLDARGGFMKTGRWLPKKIYPYAAYFAFHGGQGESGPLQGLFETIGIPFTSPNQEASVLTMNKYLTKQVVSEAGIETAPGSRLFSFEIKEDVENSSKKIIQKLGLPAIIKPVHLGSSIGIKISRSEVELEKFLLEAAFIDNEILVEKYLSSFVEYNCSVRVVGGKVEASEIERPFSKDEILSFADKYQRGGKKTGAGMASLQRELPAKIDDDLKKRLQESAKKAFVACRCKGMVRIDFMYTNDKKLYLTEINPIPGSMAFYLWEASGISFKQQISDLIEQAVVDAAEAKSRRLEYETDIVGKFVS